MRRFAALAGASLLLGLPFVLAHAQTSPKPKASYPHFRASVFVGGKKITTLTFDGDGAPALLLVNAQSVEMRGQTATYTGDVEARLESGKAVLVQIHADRVVVEKLPGEK